ncbi:class I SAM-dependent methyltransferase [Devosia nitrariae]|uniref:Methyltransferase n=1 Tax=Devosia nitrariae TaxID=2071872 RepID=A0ABQ5WC95_9HYPH|nr:methyltransferase domain-containing protein [Devosia nitrariae]GLQ57130.1 methyltransferase [Devosia nitrariae]
MNAALSALREAWLAEEREAFSGWDFSHIADRIVEDSPPWDYLGMAQALMPSSASMLDVDTGGGERLLDLRDHWPAKVVASEGYPPNVAVARERLTPFGVEVVEMDANSPRYDGLSDNQFDLVINRHGAFNAAELTRILTRGGVFLTQQVHGLSTLDLLAHFAATSKFPDATYENATEKQRSAGLQITGGADWTGAFVVRDVGALVYYLKALPWLVPDFSVETHFVELLALQQWLEGGEQLVFGKRLYWLEARAT